MKVEVDLDKIIKRKSDDRGRISLPRKQYRNQEIEIAILDTTGCICNGQKEGCSECPDWKQNKEVKE